MLIGLLLGPWLVACTTDPLLPIEPGVPDARWPDIYFPSVDALAEHAGLPKLREQPSGYQADDEVRIWIGFGLMPLRGVRMTRGADGPTVEHVGYGFPIDEQTGRRVLQAVRTESAHSAEALWKSFDRFQIAELPDGRHLGLRPVPDGVGYLFEVYQDGRYRAFLYSYPQQSRAWQVRRVKRFILSLEDELGLEGLWPTPLR